MLRPRVARNIHYKSNLGPYEIIMQYQNSKYYMVCTICVHEQDQRYKSKIVF